MWYAFSSTFWGISHEMLHDGNPNSPIQSSAVLASFFPPIIRRILMEIRFDGSGHAVKLIDSLLLSCINKYFPQYSVCMTYIDVEIWLWLSPRCPSDALKSFTP